MDIFDHFSWGEELQDTCLTKGPMQQWYVTEEKFKVSVNRSNGGFQTHNRVAEAASTTVAAACEVCRATHTSFLFFSHTAMLSRFCLLELGECQYILITPTAACFSDCSFHIPNPAGLLSLFYLSLA